MLNSRMTLSFLAQQNKTRKTPLPVKQIQRSLQIAPGGTHAVPSGCQEARVDAAQVANGRRPGNPWKGSRWEDPRWGERVQGISNCRKFRSDHWLLTQGIAKFLSACKNETQCLEASKNLLLGQLRIDMLKFELNKLRRGRGSPARKQGNPSYAAVSLSDLRWIWIIFMS